MQQTLNIITRTSNRPNGFKRLRDTIKSQTYTKINHVVISDKMEDLTYINQNGYDRLISVNRRKLMAKDKKSGKKVALLPGCTKYSPHNLYFNEIQNLGLEGWVLYMDDDDYFTDENTLQLMMINTAYPSTTNEDVLFLHQMAWGPDKILLPPIIDNDNPPTIGQIGSPCILFHTKWLPTITWDSKKCGDFRIINQLWNTIPLHLFINKEFIQVPLPGLGKKEDI